MPEPAVVYHYTSAETLLKIVRTKGEECIWATNIRYLNDVMESEHCLRMLRHRLPEFLRAHPSVRGIDLEAALFQISSGEWDAPYVASFSLHRDSLPQWRSYCPNGNGVSVGFRVNALKNSTLAKGSPSIFGSSMKSRLEAVRYLRDDDWEMADGILMQSLQELDDWHQRQDKLPYEERTDASDDRVLETIISSQCSLIKHAAFEGEKEYRLIAPDSIFGGVMKFRASKTTVIPYFEVLMPDWGNTKNGPPKFSPTFDDYFIEEIVVGPTPNPDLTISALSQLFMRKSVPLPVRKSSVPFRDL